MGHSECVFHHSHRFTDVCVNGYGVLLQVAVCFLGHEEGTLEVELGSYGLRESDCAPLWSGWRKKHSNATWHTVSAAGILQTEDLITDLIETGAVV